MNILNRNSILPAINTPEENAKFLATRYQFVIKPGEGLFFDYSQTPELEKPLLDYLKQHYGWVQEKPFFIRKPTFYLN